MKNGKRRPRSINNEHLEKYEWLAISVHNEHKGAWCAFCVLFSVSDEAGGRRGTGEKLGRLVTSPLTDFSKLTGKDGVLDCHEKNDYHVMNKVRAIEFMKHGRSDRNITSLINVQHREEILRNRAALFSIVDTLKFAAIQDIALRGHRDSGRIDASGKFPDENDGNFRMLLRFRIQSGDEQLKEHFCSASSKNLYTSPQVQNELLSDIAILIKKSLSDNIKSSFVWTVMADETTDASNREQMVIVARYVQFVNGNYSIKEDPICLLDLFQELKTEMASGELRMSGKNMARTIMAKLSEMNLDMSELVAQSYDGAAAMSSQRVGVLAIIKESAPLALYFHCTVHALNLSTSRINSVECIRNTLGTMETIIVFVTDGAKRESLFKTVQEENNSSKHKLKKICHTRFVERHVAVERFCNEIGSITEALQTMTHWEDRKSSSTANNLMTAIQKPDFIVGLAIVKHISLILRPLSIQLQEKGADLMQALSMISSVKKILKDARESGF